MGRFRIGVGLLAVLLALSIGAQLGMGAMEKPLLQALNNAMEQAQQENFAAAGAEIARAQETWQRTRDFSAVLADHQYLEDIDAQLAMLAIWAEGEEKRDFLTLCADTVLRIRAVADAHRLSIPAFF